MGPSFYTPNGGPFLFLAAAVFQASTRIPHFLANKSNSSCGAPLFLGKTILFDGPN